jgi:zinc transporter ZupT
MSAEISIPYWAAGLYGLLGAAGIVAGGTIVGRGGVRQLSSSGVWPGVGAGFLIALGVLGALPDACERIGSNLIGGALALTSFLALLFAHGAGHRDAKHGHSHGSHGGGSNGGSHAGLSLHDARLAVAGLALHALLDGVAVSAALASLQELGLVVAFFVVLHKIPEGATAAALTYASGGEAKRARGGVLLVAAASLLGGLTIFAVAPVLGYALGVAAGVTAGVGVGIATHLLRHDRNRAAIGLALGAALFAVGEHLLDTHH